MQDIYTIGVGSGGRFFSGGGGGDRRLRPHHHQGLGGQSPKCPRCDSANTKFCYYNNYNLSQPRHFCKSCRRYWTKGGVLRNVPVGGGCRKTKRNSSTTAKPKSSPKSNNSNSSSESNPSFKPMTSSSAPINPTFDPLTSSSDSGKRSFAPVMSSSGPLPGGDIYSGSFTSMMTSSPDPLMELDFGGDQSLGRQQWTRKQGNITSDEPATRTMPDELKISVGFLDPMAQMDLSGRDQDGLGAMDHELLDLYWTQPQWNGNDHALYLP